MLLVQNMCPNQQLLTEDICCNLYYSLKIIHIQMKILRNRYKKRTIVQQRKLPLCSGIILIGASIRNKTCQLYLNSLLVDRLLSIILLYDLEIPIPAKMCWLANYNPWKLICSFSRFFRDFFSLETYLKISF